MLHIALGSLNKNLFFVLQRSVARSGFFGTELYVCAAAPRSGGPRGARGRVGDRRASRADHTAPHGQLASAFRLGRAPGRQWQDLLCQSYRTMHAVGAPCTQVSNQFYFNRK